MHRLVIALTTLLGLAGAAVVAAYLFLFSASTDRAAQFVPADSVAYVNVYLQPSAGQQLNLESVIGRFPGFGDAATLDVKIDELVQRLLGDARIDYRNDVKPWLGDQLAIAVASIDVNDPTRQLLLLADVRDAAAAEAALGRLTSDAPPTTEAYGGTTLHLASNGEAYAIVDRMLMFGAADEVRAAIDTGAGGESLATQGAFGDAMASLPADHLASFYVDIAGAAAADGTAADATQGFSVASGALVAEPNGVRLTGSAPFDEAAAGTDASASFALSTEPSSLAGWMPAQTEASAVIFALGDLLASAEEAAGSTPEVADALVQLRALAAFGLGIDVDADLLPLLDREVALGVSGLAAGVPDGILVLRPSDPDAAAATLARVADALEARGSERSTVEAAGETIVSIAVPQLGSVSYVLAGDVMVLGLSPEALGAALEAHETGETLAASDAYRETFEQAGDRAGNELYLDVAALLGTASELAGLDAETRAILEPIRTVGITAPARDDRLEFNAMVTVE